MNGTHENPIHRRTSYQDGESVDLRASPIKDLHWFTEAPWLCRHEREGRGLLDGRAQRTVDRRWGLLHGAQQFLIAMRSPLDSGVLAAVKAALNGHSGWAGSFVPDSSVLGIGTAAAAEAAGRVPGVLWVVRICPLVLWWWYSACENTCTINTALFILHAWLHWLIMPTPLWA